MTNSREMLTQAVLVPTSRARSSSVSAFRTTVAVALSGLAILATSLA